jgi:hypothetical protein
MKGPAPHIACFNAAARPLHRKIARDGQGWSRRSFHIHPPGAQHRFTESAIRPCHPAARARTAASEDGWHGTAHPQGLAVQRGGAPARILDADERNPPSHRGPSTTTPSRSDTTCCSFMNRWSYEDARLHETEHQVPKAVPSLLHSSRRRKELGLEPFVLCSRPGRWAGP